MGYMHINNLYKDQEILLHKECYALEKIHGTSAHIKWKDGQLHFFSGGENNTRFVALFDQAKLKAAFEQLGLAEVVVFGEAYGGSQQKQSHRYGKDLKFIAFDVMVAEEKHSGGQRGGWLGVPKAAALVVQQLELEFVWWERLPTDLNSLDAARDRHSEQAKRNGIEEPQFMEGVVLRPLTETYKDNGDRLIVKHKRAEERETATPREVDQAQYKVITDARAAALEWVTERRLEHVLDKLLEAKVMEHTGMVIKAMLEDVFREGAGELVDDHETRKAVSRRAALLWKAKVREIVNGTV